MSKQDYIFRYLSIIKKLRRSGEATFREISEHLENESGLLDRPRVISIRTFQRDLSEIRQIFRIDIRYDFRSGVYYIADDEQKDLNLRLLESMETINSLRVFGGNALPLYFEKRRAQGTNHFHGLILAIRNRAVIRMTHQRFDDEVTTVRLAEPFALKESKGRWYLLARDRGDRRIKTFGLDRILNFETTPDRFDMPPSTDLDQIFRFSFGVINPTGTTPEEIILSFLPEQGKYIKSYPLHESQEVILDNEKELRIRLSLHVTYDLVMEILSYGKNVRAISPPSLVNQLKEIYRHALEQYP